MQWSRAVHGRVRTRRLRVLLRNISVGGCFVAMPTLPSENGELKIVVWVNEAN